MFFETTNKKLEQFLFYHDIFFSASRRSDDGSTVWKYEQTPYLSHVLEEWNLVLTRREERKRFGFKPMHEAVGANNFHGSRNAR